MKVKKLIEMVLKEAGEEVIDYDSPVHPKLKADRENMKKAIDWIANGLDKSGTPQMKRLSKQLRGVPDLPSDQILPTLKAITGELHSAKRDFRNVNQQGAKEVEDALQGFPSIMKAAGALASSNTSDKGLWAKKVKGYVDDKTGQFRTTGTVVHPTGMDSDDIKGAQAKASGEKELPPKPAPKKPGFTIRKKGQSESVWSEALDALGEGDVIDFPGGKKKGKDEPAKKQTGGSTHKNSSGTFSGDVNTVLKKLPKLNHDIDKEALKSFCKEVDRFVDADIKITKSKPELEDELVELYDMVVNDFERFLKSLDAYSNALPDEAFESVVKEATVDTSGEKPPLESVKGKYIHVGQDVENRGFEGPYTIETEKLTYNDIHPSWMRMLRIDDNPKVSQYSTVYKIEQDGRLKCVGYNWDSSD